MPLKRSTLLWARVLERSAWPGLLQSGLTTIGLSTIKRRELRLLGRDRNFLVQTLLLPVVIVGSQMFFNGKLNSIAELGLHHTTAAAIAFGIGSYVLMLSAFQTLNNEGQVLWLLYTFPRSLESVLREKAQLWGALALLYPLAVFGATAWYAPQLDGHLLGLFLVVVIGIPVYSVIAVALGVFACDPLAQEVRARVRPTYVYLYMLLASFYTYSVYAEAWSQKLVVMVLTGSLALALWQKARDELPYLLDPAASPGARVSTADGLIAATMFFVLQALIMVLLAAGGRTIGTGSVVVAFGIAGAVVYALARLLYWRNKTAGVPAILRGGDAAASLRMAVRPDRGGRSAVRRVHIPGLDFWRPAPLDGRRAGHAGQRRRLCDCPSGAVDLARVRAGPVRRLCLRAQQNPAGAHAGARAV
jgi:hypothetical protein